MVLHFGMKRVLFGLGILIFLNGCLFVPFSATRIVPKGETEIGAGGIVGEKMFSCGEYCFEQEAWIIRKGIGHNMDYGIAIGLPPPILLGLGLDIRKQIVSESPLHPSIVLSGRAFGYYGLDAGSGGGISLQFRYKIFSFVSDYLYTKYRWQDWCADFYHEESLIFPNTLLIELPIPIKSCSRYSITFLIGKYFEYSLENNPNRSLLYWGITFLGRKS